MRAEDSHAQIFLRAILNAKPHRLLNFNLQLGGAILK